MGKKVAIVYDWMDKWGGVERLLLVLHEVYPDLHFYTSYVDPQNASWAKNLDIRTSFIQRLPSFIKRNRIVSTLLYPFAFESFDFSSYDTVLSITSSYAKGIITKPQTKHISYILTPPRFLWGMTDLYLPGWKKLIVAPLLAKMREVDFITSKRPDCLVTLSHHIQKRIKKYYHRESSVVYPPFDSTYWKNIKQEKISGLPDSYYLVVSRLEPYKQIELIRKTAMQMPQVSFVIVGSGSLFISLKESAPENMHFFQHLSDEKLAYAYTHAEALIMPQEEDFGYVSLEAQSFNCPVIAYKDSGASETVIDQQTGLLFDMQNVFCLQATLERYVGLSYNIRRNLKETANVHLQQFEKKYFTQAIQKLIEM